MQSEDTLWQALVRAGERAHASGAQRSIPTRFRTLDEKGVPFVVRMIENLKRKTRPRRDNTNRPGERVPPNPFLPYDPEMFVAEVSSTHIGLLNKFNVVDHHLLVVTRAFEEQESLLTPRDMEALWICLGAFPSLGFYNAGSSAGASQRHKHLQVIPLPLATDVPNLPIAAFFERSSIGSQVGRAEALPFDHAVARLDWHASMSPGEMARITTDRYQQMVHHLGLVESTDDGVRRSRPYNLLVTRDWMMMIPRTRECFHTISLNAMAFAGTFLVRDEASYRDLEKQGPMAALRCVGRA